MAQDIFSVSPHIMLAFTILLIQIIDIYIWIVIIGAILSWLAAFGIVNPRNRFVYALEYFIAQLTEPIYRQMRRVVPLLGSFDLSPFFLVLLLGFIRNLLAELLMRGVWP